MAFFRSTPIIADRAEFVEALDRLRRGHVLVKAGDGSCSCVLDGGLVHHSFDTLHRYGLIDEFDNPRGFEGVRYFRITRDGREFADRAWSAWRKTRPLERLMVRLVG
jgi:hypothetical protein